MRRYFTFYLFSLFPLLSCLLPTFYPSLTWCQCLFCQFRCSLSVTSSMVVCFGTGVYIDVYELCLFLVERLSVEQRTHSLVFLVTRPGVVVTRCCSLDASILLGHYFMLNDIMMSVLIFYNISAFLTC